MYLAPIIDSVLESKKDKLLGKRLHEDTKDDRLTASFKRFHKCRRDKVYMQLNKAEQDRFEAHNEAFG